MWLSAEVLDDLEVNRQAYDLEKACRRLEIPYLAIHGERDEAVPVEESRSLHEWTASAVKRFELIPGTGHTFGASHPWQGSTPAWTHLVGVTASWFEERFAQD
jgi:pimeloyl-ACP methyl ester carboxylesterase